jgi:hypothetical protein
MATMSNGGCSNHPVIVSLGILASIVALIAFFTGKQSLRELSESSAREQERIGVAETPDNTPLEESEASNTHVAQQPPPASPSEQVKSTPEPQVPEPENEPTSKMNSKAGPEASTVKSWPSVDWGALGSLFSVRNAKFHRQVPVPVPGAGIVKHALLFTVESRSSMFLTLCSAHFYDAYGVEVGPVSPVLFTPHHFVEWTPGQRSHALAILPDNISEIESITFQCR